MPAERIGDFVLELIIEEVNLARLKIKNWFLVKLTLSEKRTGHRLISVRVNH